MGKDKDKKENAEQKAWRKVEEKGSLKAGQRSWVRSLKKFMGKLASRKKAHKQDTPAFG